jgi:hypothetical protein
MTAMGGPKTPETRPPDVSPPWSGRIIGKNLEKKLLIEGLLA